jgi:hypothetical protein
MKFTNLRLFQIIELHCEEIGVENPFHMSEIEGCYVSDAYGNPNKNGNWIAVSIFAETLIIIDREWFRAAVIALDGWEEIELKRQLQPAIQYFPNDQYQIHKYEDRSTYHRFMVVDTAKNTIVGVNNHYETCLQLKENLDSLGVNNES